MTPEDQRLEQIKQWWYDNRGTIVSGVVLAIAIIGGWGAWTNYVQSQREEASALFQQVIRATIDSNFDLGQRAFAELQGSYNNTVYFDQAHLLMAKLNYDTDNVEQARTLLRNVIETSSDEVAGYIAHVRLGHLLNTEGEYAETLELLEGEAGAFESHYQELRGDAFRALGRYEEAESAYRAAIEALESDSPYETIITLKLNDALVEN